jgi:hypothetical protein
MVGVLFRPERRRLNILTLARDLWTLRIIHDHIPRSSAAGGINLLLDRRRGEILRGCGRCGFRWRGDVACIEEKCWSATGHEKEMLDLDCRTGASPAVRDISGEIGTTHGESRMRFEDVALVGR